MFDSVRERAARIDGYAVVAGLMKVIVSEVGDRLGGRARRQQESQLSASTLCPQGQGNGALALNLWVNLLTFQLFVECWAHSPS